MGRIYFHWLVRESEQAAWFEDLLNELAKEDLRCFLDLNIHITREKPPVWIVHILSKWLEKQMTLLNLFLLDCIYHLLQPCSTLHALPAIASLC